MALTLVVFVLRICVGYTKPSLQSSSMPEQLFDSPVTIQVLL